MPAQEIGKLEELGGVLMEELGGVIGRIVWEVVVDFAKWVRWRLFERHP